MTTTEEMKAAATEAAKWWWLWLVAGILWILVSLIILQFDSSSVRTVGFIIGVMLFVAGLQYVTLGVLAEGWKWIWYLFGGVLLFAGLVAMVNPTRVFANVADMLGFLFALVGIVWMIEALATREVNSLWWLSLVAGILMIVLGFWAGGQFFFDKAYTLLVFAGIWAMMKGFLDLIRAFQIRTLGVIASDF